MNLEDIFMDYGIFIKEKGKLRNTIDVLEDMYLLLTPEDFCKLVKDIDNAENQGAFCARNKSIFQEAREEEYGEE